jgi:hypothetical protein
LQLNKNCGKTINAVHSLKIKHLWFIRMIIFSQGT